MEPVVLALKEKYGKDVEFVIVDVATEEGQALAEEYEVSLIPALFVLNGQGSALYSDIGYQPAAKIEPYIGDALKK